MANSTITTMDALLKLVYEPMLQEQVNTKVPLFAQLKRQEQMVQGKDFTLGLHTARNQAVGSAAENADLIDPGEEGFGTCVLPKRYNYGSFALSGPLIASARSNLGAFASVVDAHMRGLQLSLKFEMNRQMFGTGAGTLCLVNGAVASDLTVTCDGGIGSAVGTTRRIYENQVLDFWNAAGTVRQAQRIKVAGITSATVFTVDQNITVDDNAIICRAGARDTSGGLYCMGISLIADSAGALQSLNPATAGQAYWAAYERALGGAITELALLVAVDSINTECGEDPNLMVMTKGIRRSYFDLLDDQIDFRPQVLPGGWKTMTFAAGGSDIAMLVDDDCPLTNIYLLNTNYLPFIQIADFSWLDKGGILRPVENKDAYRALLFHYGNLGCTRRNAHGKITGVTES